MWKQNRYSASAVFVLVLCQMVVESEAIHSATSWGDPHITTIDGVQYDFNGHGEYVFLKDEGNLEVQARTDYLAEGNRDSTIFVAFAVKDTFGVFEIHWDKTSKDLTVYQNGTQMCVSSDPKPVPCRIKTGIRIRGILAGDEKIIIQSNGLTSRMASMTFKGGSDMSVTMDKIKPNTSHTSVKGLAGGSMDGGLVARNSSRYNITSSSPAQLFEFGESWRVTENQSLFNYSVGCGSYSSCNTFSRPTFYEDYLNNRTELFNLKGHSHNDTDVAIFESLCNETEVQNECLLAIARSDDYSRGEAVMTAYRHKQYMYDFNHNSAPAFTAAMPKTWDVYLADNKSISLNLSDYTYDNNSRDVLSYSLETNIPAGDWQLDEVKGVFNWTIHTTLRNLSDSIKITFVVTDKFNYTSASTLTVDFCGCNETSQCSKDSAGKCKCGNKYITGDYCEVYLDPCNMTTCFNQSLCDGTTVDKYTGPCAPCPKGRFNEFTNELQKCVDVDECDINYQEADRCDAKSDCNNTDGSYTCICHEGYSLMPNGYTCEDIDECKIDTKELCEKNEICKNTEGHYTCECIGGYSRKDDICRKIEGVSYVFDVRWSLSPSQGQDTNPDTPANRDAAKIFLIEKLNNTAGFLGIDIVSITFVSTGDRVRRSEQGLQLKLEYIIHLFNATAKNTIRNIVEIQLAAGEAKTNIGTIQFAVGSSPLVDLINDGLCVVPGRTDCDPSSTDCVDVNGTYECRCKSGYERQSQHIKNICSNIDECTTTSVKDLCVGGTCLDLQGTWNCSCPSDTVWMNVGTPKDPLYRCQENYTFVGEVNFDALTNFTDIELTNFTQDKLMKSLGNSSTNATFDPTLGTMVTIRELFVRSTVLSKTRTITGVSFYSFRITFAIRMGLPVDPTILHNVVDKIDLSDVEAKTAIHFKIFNESDNMLCNISNKCDDSSTECVTENGTTHCACLTGYTSSSLSPLMCQDINECAPNSEYTCVNGQCKNTIGNWSCECHSGFKMAQNGTQKHNWCVDINECSENSSTCENGQCSNNNGSYVCTCHTGFQHINDNNKTCVDIHECAQNSEYTCVNGQCKDLPGNWSCECNIGYTTAQNNTPMHKWCSDIDECRPENKDICENGTCNNMDGSYFCTCQEGFQNPTNNNQTCQDIDECLNPSRCVHGGCVNSVGSWGCKCDTGFRNDNNTCVDIDECHEYSYGCLGSWSGACYNYEGSWRCVCDSGGVAKPFNRTSQLCSEDFTFMASLGVLLTATEHGRETISGFIQENITNAYLNKYPNEKVLTDHISFTTFTCTIELSRAVYFIIGPTPRGINVTFLLIFALPKTTDEIESVWDYLSATCPCKYNSTNFLLEPGTLILEGLNEGICTLKEHCDTSSQDCLSKNGQVTCQCKQGYRRSNGSTSCIRVTGTIVEASFNFTLNGRPDNTTLYTSIETLIHDAYVAKFNTTLFTVTVITIYGPGSSNEIRRKRDAANSTNTSYSCKYKIEFNTTISTKEISQNNNTITDYVQKAQANGSSNSTTLPAAFRSIGILAETNQDINQTSGIVLNAGTTTPSSPARSTTESTKSTPCDGCDVIKTQKKEDSSDLKTILIVTGSVLGGLVLILVIAVACICRARRSEKPKEESTQEQISMGYLGPGYEYTPASLSQSSQQMQESPRYDRFANGNQNQHNQMSRQSLPHVASLPGLPRYETGRVKVLPSNGKRPPSPEPDYHIVDRRSSSPRPDYHPSDDGHYDTRWTTMHGGSMSNGYRPGAVSVYPMTRTRSLETMGPDYNQQPGGPIYAQPVKGFLRKNGPAHGFKS